MGAQGVDLLFCPPSGDLEYLTGARRRFPTFGNISYTHGWVCGAFFRPGHDPVFVLPRMVAEFDMPTGIPGEFVVVNETDDGAAVFDRLVKGLGPLGTIAVEQRTWAETLLALGRASDAKIVSGVSLTNPMRRIKSPAELERMKAACHIADKAMGVVTDDIADGVARAPARRGGRQPAPPGRLTRRLVRHRRLGDGTVDHPRCLRPRDERADARRQRGVVRLRLRRRRVLLGLRAHGGDRRHRATSTSASTTR